MREMGAAAVKDWAALRMGLPSDSQKGNAIVAPAPRKNLRRSKMKGGLHKAKGWSDYCATTIL